MRARVDIDLPCLRDQFGGVVELHGVEHLLRFGQRGLVCQESTDWGWQNDPLGLRIALNEIYARYEIPLMVVENSTGTYERRRKDSFFAYQKIIKSNGTEGLD